MQGLQILHLRVRLLRTSVTASAVSRSSLLCTWLDSYRPASHTSVTSSAPTSTTIRLHSDQRKPGRRLRAIGAKG
jgi:hypothetical protein